MYTLRDEDGGRDLVIEHGLKQLEDQFSTIRKKKLRRQLELDRNEHFFMCAFDFAPVVCPTHLPFMNAKNDGTDLTPYVTASRCSAEASTLTILN